jgi:flagellar motor switch protein FliM
LSQILSQNEIDELLNTLTGDQSSLALSKEDEKKGRVRDFDFRMANKFPKEQMRTLRVVFEGFARSMATHLSGVMRTVCEAEVVSVEEQAFSEFNNSLISPVILAIFNFEPLYGQLMMQVPSGIVDAIISRVFGGKAISTERNKAFTEIELVTVERLLRQVLRLLSEAWEKIMHAEPSLDRLETSPQFAQIVPPNETVAIITIKVIIREMVDLINICIPHMAMEPVAKELNSKVRFEGHMRRKYESHEGTITQRLANTEVTLHAVLDETVASVNDLINLQVGDVVCLNHGVNRDITVMAEHIPKFKGKVGMVGGGRFAVRVTDIIEEEREHE